MIIAIKAGVLYFAVVFAAGFFFGALRVLAVAPRLGEFGAVVVELPIILAISWTTCARLIDNMEVDVHPVPRLIMGGLAFALLMAGEIGVSVLGFGRSLAQHLEAYRAPAAMLGLAAQIAFALFPIAQMKRAI